MSEFIADEKNTSDLSPTQYVMRKLPHVTALFWIIKTIATTLGETAGDMFSQTLRLGNLVATILLLGFLLIAVVIQLRARRFHAALFWTVIALTSTAGTTLSDLLNRNYALGYAGGALILGTGLAIVLVIWWRSGQTLDVENLATFKGELLFWIAVVFSNSLGTSTGDFLAGPAGLGLRGTALLLSAIMVALLAAHYFPRINGMLLFWIAFILTRPLGAVLGNILSRAAITAASTGGTPAQRECWWPPSSDWSPIKRFGSTATPCCRCLPRSTAARVNPSVPTASSPPCRKADLSTRREQATPSRGLPAGIMKPTQL